MSRSNIAEMFEGFVPLLVEILPDLLLPGQDVKLHEIYWTVKEYLPDQCDDSVECSCGNRASNQPEWKHQVRWVMRELAKRGIIYRKGSETYMLLENGKRAVLVCFCCGAAYKQPEDARVKFCISCGSLLVSRLVENTAAFLEFLGDLTLN